MPPAIVGSRRARALLLLVAAAPVLAAIDKADDSSSQAVMEDEPLEIVPLVISLLAGVLMAWCIVREPAPGSPPAEARRRPTKRERAISAQEIRRHDGRDGRPIWIVVRGNVFDVTSHPSGRDLYGEGSAYASFAGRDATVGLAMGTFDPAESAGKTLDDLGVWELDALEEWYQKFLWKYDIVGQLIPGDDPNAAEDGTGGAGSAGTNGGGVSVTERGNVDNGKSETRSGDKAAPVGRLGDGSRAGAPIEGEGSFASWKRIQAEAARKIAQRAPASPPE